MNPHYQGNPIDIVKAVGQMGTMKFFPSEQLARTAVMGTIGSMVQNKAQLDWLTTVMVQQVGEWPYFHFIQEKTGALKNLFKAYFGKEFIEKLLQVRFGLPPKNVIRTPERIPLSCAGL